MKEIKVFKKSITEYNFTQKNIAIILLNYISKEMNTNLLNTTHNDIVFENDHDVKAGKELSGLRASLKIENKE